MVSTGKQLHNLGLTQGSLLKATLFNDDVKKDLCTSRLNLSDRSPTKNKHLIQDDDLLVVLSQECDIACNLDVYDPLIELALFKRLKENDLHPGNQYVQSVRKLQLKIDEEWFQASLAHICWINKEKLLQLLSGINVECGNQELALVLSTWRSNRYNRAALPDNFNETIDPFLAEALTKLDSHGDDIISLYVNLNSYDEIDDYIFDVFALTVTEMTDDKFAKILMLMENLSYMIEENSNFKGSEGSEFAVRQADISVEKISNYRRLNLDYLSLSSQSENKFKSTKEEGPAPSTNKIKILVRYLCIKGLRWSKK